MHASMIVNGETVSAEVEPRVQLVDLLRNELGLTGTKVGCDTGHCGSCVVRVGGRSVKSCQMLAVQAEGARITTIEGVADHADDADESGLIPLQQSLWETHGVQCGFCAPGLVMSLLDLLDVDPAPDEQTVRGWLDGNLCRCTGYQSIVRAVLSVAASSEAPAIRETPAATDRDVPAQRRASADRRVPADGRVPERAEGART